MKVSRKEFNEILGWKWDSHYIQKVRICEIIYYVDMWQNLK